jgi:hypothetical protein
MVIMGFIVWVNSETWNGIDNRVLFDFDGAIKQIESMSGGKLLADVKKGEKVRWSR